MKTDADVMLYLLAGYTLKRNVSPFGFLRLQNGNLQISFDGHSWETALVNSFLLGTSPQNCEIYKEKKFMDSLEQLIDHLTNGDIVYRHDQLNSGHIKAYYVSNSTKYLMDIETNNAVSLHILNNWAEFFVYTKNSCILPRDGDTLELKADYRRDAGDFTDDGSFFNIVADCRKV